MLQPDADGNDRLRRIKSHHSDPVLDVSAPGIFPFAAMTLRVYGDRITVLRRLDNCFDCGDIGAVPFYGNHSGTLQESGQQRNAEKLFLCEKSHSSVQRRRKDDSVRIIDVITAEQTAAGGDVFDSFNTDAKEPANKAGKNFA